MITLHFSSNSRSQRVLWLLEELELPYKLNKIKFHPSELKSEEHRKRHPLGRVPVLEDKDVIIFESGAIIEYIIAKYDRKELKPGVDSDIFPTYLQWYHYCEGMVMPPMNTVVVHTLILPPERRNPEILRQAKNLLTKSILPVDELLSKNKFLIKDNISGVDFMLGHSLFMANNLGCVSDDMKNILRYLELINSLKSFNKAVNT
ncbi:MAG: hypothetical protein CFH34_00767 [Alphaproteobacteria bacterium MarineAlpha9_Bin4]|nr:glutathione S-transferase [Pelagibacterales bacterium]PPR26745.1 MAG: hypothetical protein CFH34_00767 [Alphaproteobacteria bacterium MarineAlpha9_Bin4]|tara:strand:- start:1483 stop:2094 length:612 start_codon:yes stop_codon:yes gene_type:complete